VGLQECDTGGVMGLYDRDYTREDYQHRYQSMPQMRFAFPRITPVVKWLLIINIGVHFAKVIFFQGPGSNIPPLERLFSVYPAPLWKGLEVWRLISYQFLHWNGWHLLMNMLALYFLGPTLERHWGGRKFLKFYLGCGAAGGLFYLALVAVNFLEPLPMVGASGAILGLLAACAILFPHFVVFLFFFPIPIRVAAVGFTLLYILNILTKQANAGGDAAHLAGMAAGAFYVLSESWRSRLKLKIRTTRWEKRARAERAIQQEVDRILEKVHNSGIHSLSGKEKRLLRRATELERMRKGL